MKKVNITFLLTILMSMVGLNASAYSIAVKNADGVSIYYNYINNNTELEVTYKGSYYGYYLDEYIGNIVIPESVSYNEKTYSVTSIGGNAFYGCSSLYSVTIPNSVTSIGKNAFGYCSRLTSVTIPNSVTSIGNSAFGGCSSLTSVTIDSNTILSKAYTFDSSLKNIFGNQVKTYIIGNSVTSIGQYAFYECSGLTSVTIPNSVTSIGSYAFSYCKGLTSITIPNSVTSIGSGAFYGCI